ncbi:MAG: hypothetical protein ACI4RM_02505 [Ruminococcus sp.]
MTNFEKIKQMNIDEMAEQLFFILDCDDCPIEKYKGYSDQNCNNGTCKGALKKWLESEAEE